MSSTAPVDRLIATQTWSEVDARGLDHFASGQLVKMLSLPR
jgi:hypothetical protein